MYGGSGGSKGGGGGLNTGDRMDLNTAPLSSIKEAVYKNASEFQETRRILSSMDVNSPNRAAFSDRLRNLSYEGDKLKAAWLKAKKEGR